MTRGPWNSEHGLTLTEVTIVAVLASIVMLGLVGFYMSSQGTWMQASAQAITQREATNLMESIADRVHAAGAADIPPGANQLSLYENSGSAAPMYVFWWNAPDTMTIAAEDELIHEGVDINHDRGSMITSKCERFACKAGMGLVEVDVLLRSAEGDTVHVTSKFAMMNNPS